MAGPLTGVQIVELAGIGPGPFCAMMLADMGAEVVRVDRPDQVGRSNWNSYDVLNRGRRTIAVNLKHPDGVEVVMKLIEAADGLIEGFRPGVAERLGLGPDLCWERNPGLVYGRMTGWGQNGPLSHTAGHDIDYIAISGVLGAIGRAGERPVPPLNLVGDFGGGGLLLAFGMVCGLLEARESGLGQVVDAAMTDGSSILSTFVYGLAAAGLWDLDRKGTNLLDSGAPWYDTYATADGLYMAVGAIEPQFYQALLNGLGLSETDLPAQHDAARWPDLRRAFAERFAEKTREGWVAVFDGTDACVAPVLRLSEAAEHPHNVARSTFVDIDGITQPAPAPRFSRTPSATPAPPAGPGTHTDLVLADMGLSVSAIKALRESGAIA
ncbi:MAG: CoA transferase [Acidimicrobiia bacterium]|nr:CoA transferase [Acidimicrobiia bacterium]